LNATLYLYVFKLNKSNTIKRIFAGWGDNIGWNLPEEIDNGTTKGRNKDADSDPSCSPGVPLIWFVLFLALQVAVTQRLD